MVEVVRGIRHRSAGDKIFGKPIRPLPERIGPAVARNGSRRETPPGGSRRETLIVRDLVQKPYLPERGPMPGKKQNSDAPLDEASRHHISKKVIVAAAGQCASRAARLYRPRGPAQSQTSFPSLRPVARAFPTSSIPLSCRRRPSSDPRIGRLRRRGCPSATRLYRF